MEQIESLAEQAAIPAIEFSIRISNASKLNLADFQNSVPLIRELGIVNESERELSHLQLRLESFPPFLKPKAWSIDVCGSRTHYGIKDYDVQLDGILLGKLTEAETSTITVTLVENRALRTSESS